MSPHTSHPPKMATREEMVENEIPLHFRDNCAHILIPLNKCRQANFYLPFYCEHERHAYEVCMYESYEKRKEIKKAMKK